MGYRIRAEIEQEPINFSQRGDSSPMWAYDLLAMKEEEDEVL